LSVIAVTPLPTSTVLLDGCVTDAGVGVPSAAMIWPDPGETAGALDPFTRIGVVENCGITELLSPLCVVAPEVKLAVTTN